MTLKAISEQKSISAKNRLVLKVHNSGFVDFELPPGVFEVKCINITLPGFVGIYIITDDIAMKTRLKTIINLGFDEMFFKYINRVTMNLGLYI